MREIIEAVDRNLIKEELTKEVFIRNTNNGNNEIYLINNQNAPNTLKEIGRLREIAFRAAGGGTGLPYDLDESDLNEFAYDQLIAWNPEDEEIIAGYRLIDCNNVIDENGKINLSTAHYFNFSEKFIKEYLPYTMELGRSFVQPKYQPSIDNRKGLFSLDNLWDGLGAVIMMRPHIKYLFGKVTMYPQFNKEGRDLILYFMNTYFPDKEKLVEPIRPLDYFNEPSYGLFDNLDYKEGYKVLNGKIRDLGENIPPLVNTYMNLSPTMKTFGTAANNEFGEVEETGILITLEEIFESKKERYLSNFKSE